MPRELDDCAVSRTCCRKPGPLGLEPVKTPAPPIDWGYWFRRLLVCNPFFLCSAALLLFGINRLSVDPDFLSNETQKLLFNFSALQIYEVLMTATEDQPPGNSHSCPY